MRRLSRRLGLPALFLLFGVHAAFGQTLQERLEFADGLFQRDMFDLARKEYLALSRETEGDLPRDRIFYQIGECFRAEGNREPAEAYFRRLAGAAPDQEFGARASFRLGEFALKDGRGAEALPMFEAVQKVATLPPDLLNAAQLLRARSLAAIGRGPEAEKVYLELLDRAPDSPLVAAAAFEAAELVRKAGDRPDLEEKLYRRVVLLRDGEEDGAEAWLRLADLAFRTHRYDQAADAVDSLFRKNPNSPRALSARRLAAWAYLLSNRWTESRALAEQALKESPGDGASRSEWLYLLGNACRQLKATAPALAAYDELITKDPKSEYAGAAAYEAALASFQAGDSKDAIRRAAPLHPAGPLRADVDWLLAEAYHAEGQNDAAIQHYRAVLAASASPRVPDAAFRLGGMLRDRGAWIEAASVFRIAADRPEAGESAIQARHAVAYCLDRAGRHDEALIEWARLLRDAPKSPLVEDVMFRKALCEVALDHGEDASESFRAFLEAWPESVNRAEARYWRGVLLERSGHAELAAREYRAGLIAQPREELEGRLKFRLAGVLRTLDRPDDAADLFQGLLDSKMESDITGAMLRWLVERQLQRGRMDEAGSDAARLIARGKTEDPAWEFAGWYWTGRILETKKDAAAAVEAYDKASQAPGNGRETLDAFVRTGELLLGLNRAEEARTRFAAAAERTSGAEQMDLRVRALFGLGRVSETLNETEEAVRYFQSVAILFDDPVYSPQALQRAADGLRRLNRDADAEKTLLECKQRYPGSMSGSAPMETK